MRASRPYGDEGATRYRDRFAHRPLPPPPRGGAIGRFFGFAARAALAAAFLYGVYYFFFHGFEDAVGLIDRNKAPSVAQLEFDKLNSRLADNPAYRRHLSRPGAKSPAQETFKLAQSGVAKLEDKSLLRKWYLDTKIMAVMTPALCRQLLRRKMDEDFIDGYLGAISRLPATDVRQHFDLSHRLILLALDESKKASRDHLYADRGLLDRQFLAMFNEDELARFAAVVRDPQNTADADICWAVRTLYAKINQMAPLERLQLIRLLSADYRIKIRVKNPK